MLSLEERRNLLQAVLAQFEFQNARVTQNQYEHVKIVINDNVTVIATPKKLYIKRNDTDWFIFEYDWMKENIKNPVQTIGDLILITLTYGH